jgi:hypothetical protein
MRILIDIVCFKEERRSCRGTEFIPLIRCVGGMPDNPQIGGEANGTATFLENRDFGRISRFKT